MEKPQHYELDQDDPRTQLRENIIEALGAVAVHFDSTISIEGIEATDLFGMNQLLGGAIETQTVTVLNRLRDIWDPDDKYACYEFRRYPESFPDVRLVPVMGGTPLIGIELKGWYLLSKEGEPSFRFQASANAMSIYDLLVCFPWSLTNVISGQPKLHAPYIEQAKYAADRRTYYWKSRKPKGKVRADYFDIEFANTHPYPDAGSQYTDKAAYDKGGNFGRIARIGIMDEFTAQSLETPLAGIAARHWIDFLKLFSEGQTSDQITQGIQSLGSTITENLAVESDRLDTVLWHLQTAIEYMSR